MTTIDASDFDFDVAVVGYGPVGQTTAALLGQYGHRVLVIERHLQPYPLPRAVGFDGEVRRIFHRLGMDADIETETVPVDKYRWFGADGNPALEIDFSAAHPSGWATSYLFYQPAIEHALDRAARRHASVRVERGWEVQRVTQSPDHVQLDLLPTNSTESPSADRPRTVNARWVIGADGAHSIVRSSSTISLDDFGFSENWLVVDIRPHDISAFKELPRLAQLCDPNRPSAMIANGRTHRRWEFMLLEGEDASDFTEQRVWQLLEPHATPDTATLVRHTIYQFRSLSAQTLRDNRILLAGDSAHLMPPFMGKGMCSGIADAANLAWKLDLVLRALAPPQLLDSYTLERKPLNDTAIQQSLLMGQHSCILDPAQAARRDAALRAGAVPPTPPFPEILDGICCRATENRMSGAYAIQPLLRTPAGASWCDDLTGPAFALITTVGHPASSLGPKRTQFLETIGTHLITLDPDQPSHYGDIDGRLTLALAERCYGGTYPA
ncbi:bifunctional 3-(3-hydroxy-phenyl)propionate/3-hydroxycinnamic acid hydroxylase [Mycolicibacter algericus]|uniref:3-(3-hydroxyphenyl)propionate hydroxylase n=1 Tax=Mycolicibacter algericus TaxID=1288388 RepID=A0A7I9YA81_MYCAL|nr:bifunctional 3-(3-hydroxy-phenyl)propionate/3-hydroxycinnamic acid hydroxylase [Mycolicibacter algericus]GFG85625.1 3-(3-hydroxyphenyl)propionate hydroxylase [Mycolicibacter algericus]